MRCFISTLVVHLSMSPPLFMVAEAVLMTGAYRAPQKSLSLDRSMDRLPVCWIRLYYLSKHTHWARDL